MIHRYVFTAAFDGHGLCCSRGAVELLPVLSISEASVWAGPAANTGRVLDNAVAVEETVELEVRVELVEPGVVFTSPPQ